MEAASQTERPVGWDLPGASPAVGTLAHLPGQMVAIASGLPRVGAVSY